MVTTMKDALLVVGAIAAMDHTLCANGLCAECTDAMQDIYSAVAGSEAYGIRFEWKDGKIAVIAGDPIILERDVPFIRRTLTRLKQNGFDITFTD
jgi:hypothetical protein